MTSCKTPFRPLNKSHNLSTNRQRRNRVSLNSNLANRSKRNHCLRNKNSNTAKDSHKVSHRVNYRHIQRHIRMGYKANLFLKDIRRHMLKEDRKDMCSQTCHKRRR